MPSDDGYSDIGWDSLGGCVSPESVKSIESLYFLRGSISSPSDSCISKLSNNSSPSSTPDSDSAGDEYSGVEIILPCLFFLTILKPSVSIWVSGFVAGVLGTVVLIGSIFMTTHGDGSIFSCWIVLLSSSPTVMVSLGGFSLALGGVSSTSGWFSAGACVL